MVATILLNFSYGAAASAVLVRIPLPSEYGTYKTVKAGFWRAASCTWPAACRRCCSNPSGKCSYERPTRGTVCGTMRSMCGADAGCLAINYQSLWPAASCANLILRPPKPWTLNQLYLAPVLGFGIWAQGVGLRSLSWCTNCCPQTLTLEPQTPNPNPNNQTPNPEPQPPTLNTKLQNQHP